MGYWVYLARCGDGTIYTGATTDLKRRAQEHNRKSSGGHGAKYTASHLPISLVQAWEVNSWGDALRLEYAIKRCERTEKLRLIQDPWEICRIAERRKLTFCIRAATEEIRHINS
ncbi:putative endonuclease containing a URI domain [Desulfosporosinus acidiphilus SJ4]|uniref:Putative endonuclease containing a URI domain n=1 Tax=Desulfosporosinus acidiphilus (strain DSM 22704 / JCM 16185 / SJ4) TaxID=646529 RepID=I4D8D6_DESAJ|nr:GIY-YIG nuclease family protein [Desulfosporosinus acidiphilus]AFM42060.1 putative endonuclease containing a URI domain [Desulfosporosinus acidiphilus SJ4]